MIDCPDLRLPQITHRPEIHPQMALVQAKYPAQEPFFWNSRSDFDGFEYLGLGGVIHGPN